MQIQEGKAMRIAIFLLLLIAASQVFAQQTTVTTPMQGVSDGFFENISGGAGLGFGFKFPGGSGFVNAGAAQGSSRSVSSVAPSVTVMNGGQGFFADVTQQPFVLGVVPVVGGFSPMIGAQYGLDQSNAAPPAKGSTVLDERLSRIRESGGFKFTPGGYSATDEAKHAREDRAANDVAGAKSAIGARSSAEQPASSIAQIRQQQNETDEAAAREVHDLLEQGQKAQTAGKPGVARIYYQQALKRATGDLKDEVQAALRSLGDPKRSR
jgi:hypothetical protein